MTQNDDFANFYYDPAAPAGFASVSKLHRAVGNTTKERTRKWLLDQVTYSLHHPARRRFQRNRVVASSVGEMAQADLVDMSAFSAQNDGYKYLLTFIDVFSKQAFAVPVMNKTAKSILQGFMEIFDTFLPKNIQTDRGLEFNNSTLLNYMRKNNINLFFTFNQDIKAACVERFNRTLRAKMFRYFTHRGTRRFIDVLQQLLDSYNNSYHRSIRMTPLQAVKANPRTVFYNLYGFNDERALLTAEPTEKAKFKENQTVRMRYHITPMDKGYYPNFTDQTFTVVKVIKQHPRIMYKVKDHRDKLFPRKLYAEDLLAIPADPKYRIERIVRSAKRNGVKFVLVKFIGYPDSANQWLPASAVENV